jgi:protein SCO1/2
MSNSNKLKKYISLGGVLFLCPLLWLMFFGFAGKHNFRTLPYYGPENSKAVDTSTYALPDFAFTNQDGIVITKDSLKGKIWLAAFYNLADPNLVKITERLLNVDFKYKNEPELCIVVFSTDCDNDHQAARAEYIRSSSRYHTYPHKWDYLGGNNEAMQSFIRNGFLITDLTTQARFRLVDENGQIRGLYGNTEYHIQDAMEDMALLRKESDKRKYDERKKNRAKN